MALLWIEGFESYADDDDIRMDPKNGADTASVYVSSPGRYGNAMLYITSYGAWFYRDLPSTVNPVIFGFAFYLNSGSTPGISANRLLAAANIGGSYQVRFNIGSDRNIYCYNGASLYLGKTSGVPIAAYTWFYFEAKVYVHNTLGTVEVRLNGKTVMDLTAKDTWYTSTQGVSRLYFVYGNPCNTYYDDMYAVDTTGSRNNDFLGDSRIDVIRPSGPGEYDEFVPSADSSASDTNHENVDETYHDGDTTYNQTNVLNAKDAYAMDDLDPIGGTIHGLKTQVVAKKTDASARGVTPFYVLNSEDSSAKEEHAGTEVMLSDSYTLITELVEDNPDESSGEWTEEEINDMQVGLEVTT